MGCGSSSSAAPAKTQNSASQPVEKKPPPPKLFSFRVKVLGGLNLYNNDFGVQCPGTATNKFKFECKPNARVELAVEDQKQETRIIRWEVNPVFNEEFIFTANTKAPTLKVRVYDQVIASEIAREMVGQSAIIGEYDLNLHGLVSKQERELWLQLKGSRGKGELGIIVQECYRTEVKVLAGNDIQAADTFSNTSDVYMSLQVGQQAKQRTSVCKWTTSPKWDGEKEKFYFYVPYAGVDCYLQCMLWDKDLVGSDDSLGWVHFNFNTKEHPRDAANGQIKSQSVKLKIGGAKKGTIDLIVGAPDPFQPACPDPGPVTEAQKKAWPPGFPQTVAFDVKVLGAFNLAAADPNVVSNATEGIINDLFFQEYRENHESSDPFVRLEVEGAVYDTSKISNTLHPTYNESFRFVCRNKHESQIKCTIFDHDVLSANDSIGAVSIPTSFLQSGQNVQVWSTLDKKARGELGLLLTQAYQIKVRVKKANNLLAMDYNGMSDPYVTVGIEGNAFRTRIIKNDRNPIFDEDFRWAVTRVGVDTFLDVEAFDSDLVLFNREVVPDLIGRGKICLHGLKPGIPNDVVVELTTKDGKPAGNVELTVLDEMPLPPSVLEELEKLGREAFNKARDEFANTTKKLFTIITPENPDAKQEAVVEPADPRTAMRPRYSRMRVNVKGARGLVNKADASCYVCVEIPSQGKRFKTQTTQEKTNPDFGATFDFDVPTKTNGGLRFYIMDNGKVPYAEEWAGSHAAKALSVVELPFKNLNKGEGSIRGSPADDVWLDLPGGGKLVVSVEEDYRWEFIVRGVKVAAPVSKENDTPIDIRLSVGDHKYTVHTAKLQKDELYVDINESFTVFTKEKGPITLTLDAGSFGIAKFALKDVRRGVPTETELTFAGPHNASVKVYIKEEEKMGLMDQIVDFAANAARLIKAAIESGQAKELAGAAADAAADKAKDLLNQGKGLLSGFGGGK